MSKVNEYYTRESIEDRIGQLSALFPNRQLTQGETRPDGKPIQYQIDLHDQELTYLTGILMLEVIPFPINYPPTTIK